MQVFGVYSVHTIALMGAKAMQFILFVDMASKVYARSGLCWYWVQWQF